MSVPFAACMLLAAQVYHLPPRVLPSIQAVEGGQIGTVHMNDNGTADLGVMQVNTTWIQPLARYARMTPEAVETRLLNDACFNIAAAALILHTYRIEAHGDLLTAVGYYHSHTPALSADYLGKVIRSAQGMFGARRPLPHPRAANG